MCGTFAVTPEGLRAGRRCPPDDWLWKQGQSAGDVRVRSQRVLDGADLSEEGVSFSDRALRSPTWKPARVSTRAPAGRHQVLVSQAAAQCRVSTRREIANESSDYRGDERPGTETRLGPATGLFGTQRRKGPRSGDFGPGKSYNSPEFHGVGETPVQQSPLSLFGVREAINEPSGAHRWRALHRVWTELRQRLLMLTASGSQADSLRAVTLAERPGPSASSEDESRSVSDLLGDGFRPLRRLLADFGPRRGPGAQLAAWVGELHQVPFLAFRLLVAGFGLRHSQGGETPRSPAKRADHSELRSVGLDPRVAPVGRLRPATKRLTSRARDRFTEWSQGMRLHVKTTWSVSGSRDLARQPQSRQLV